MFFPCQADRAMAIASGLLDAAGPIFHGDILLRAPLARCRSPVCFNSRTTYVNSEFPGVPQVRCYRVTRSESSLGGDSSLSSPHSRSRPDRRCAVKTRRVEAGEHAIACICCTCTSAFCFRSSSEFPWTHRNPAAGMNLRFDFLCFPLCLCARRNRCG
ncbi:hypothetical protein BKA93DRAFT_802225 [Sparassis latifolia]